MKGNWLLVLLLLLLLLFGSLVIKATPNEQLLSKLRAEIVNNPDDSNKVAILHRLAKELELISHEEAEGYANRALHLSVGLNYKRGIIQSLIIISRIKDFQSDWESSLHQLNKAISLSKDGNESFIPELKLAKAKIFFSYSKLDKAFGEYTECITYFEDQSDTINWIKALEGIGTIYLMQNNLSKSFEHFVNARNLAYNIQSNERIAWSTAYIGQTFLRKDNYNKAEQQLEKAENLFLDINDETGLAWINNQLGFMSSKKKDFPAALKFYFNSLSVYQKLQNNLGIAELNLKIASTYTDLKDYASAINYANQGVQQAVKINNTNLLQEAYLLLSLGYEGLNRYEKAHQFYKKYSYIKDSVVDQERAENIDELQAKYESEKKDRQNTLLSEQMKFKDLKNKKLELGRGKDRLVRNLLIGGGFVLLLVSFLLFNRGKIKQRANQMLANRNVEILEQKSIIEKKNFEIISSMNYARKIQNAVLPSERQLARVLGDYFVFFQPKDVVSGDFYWYSEIGDEIMFTAADCTGHGIPGGFMSMISNVLLNEVVRDMKISDPKLVLSEVRRKIIYMLHASADTENKDGIDMGLCSLNKSTKVLKYAGANNPLYILRKGNDTLKTLEGDPITSDVSQSNVHLFNIKADKQPVGFFMGDLSPFTQHEVQLEEGDLVILASDGYVDQFGGEKGKKLMQSKFKSVLLMMYDYDTQHIEERLSFMFNDWKGDHEQVDDVVVLGVRV